MKYQWKSCGNPVLISMKYQWKFQRNTNYENPVETSSNFIEILMEIQLKFNRNFNEIPIEILWKTSYNFNEIPMEIQ